MQTKWIVIVGILIAAAVVGLIFGLQGKDNGEVIPPIDPTNGMEDNPYVDIPVGEPFEVEPGIVMDKAVAPAYYEFRNVGPGGLIDTWTGAGVASLGGEDVGYLEGEQLWILLYNGEDTSVTFSLKVINAPKEVNHSDITGQDYSRAPGEFLNEVDIDNSVTVDAKSAVKVPISIQFPEDLEYPDQWEFRLLVSTFEVPGTVATTLEPRFFTYMG